jgi:hypothetical protein
MIKKLLFVVAVFGLISCEDEKKETLPKYSWEEITDMSNRNFTTGAVINDQLVLMSKDWIITFDNDHNIINTQIISGEKSVETRSAYLLENSTILSIPIYYFPNPGSTDSISISFQVIGSDQKFNIEHIQIPNYQTRGYKTRRFKSDIMSNYGDDFSIIMHSWDKSDVSGMDNTDDYYSILRIKVNQSGGLSGNVDKMIDIPELPFLESLKKYDLIRFKDFDYVLASDGTYVISGNGYQTKIESTQAIFKDSENIMQLRGNSIFESNDGSTWTEKIDIQTNVDWSTTKVAKKIDNLLIDFGWSKWLKYADLVTGKTDNITYKGLSDSYGSFFIKFNGYYYYGLENGLVYRIKTDNAIEND